MRRENTATLEWSNVTLSLLGGAGTVVLDKTKNGRGGAWALDPGTAEALRRWRKLCPSDRWIFPAEAAPKSRKRRAGLHLHVDHAAAILRRSLRNAGVDRPKLYQNGNNRLQIRAHDLRATFVTLALANGRTEDWVMQRTGHGSSVMLARHRRDAETAQELGLGWVPSRRSQKSVRPKRRYGRSYPNLFQSRSEPVMLEHHCGRLWTGMPQRCIF